MGFGYPYGVFIMEFWAHGRVRIRATMEGMHTLTLTIPLNCRATSRSGSCLGISSPMCILPKFYFGNLYRPGNVIVGNLDNGLIKRRLEPLYARMNALLV